MLIEFSVTNYRSIRDRQTLSMVAASRLRKVENTFRPAVLGEKLPALLKVVAIYGPNASGKSNLIKAFGTISNICRRKPSAEPEPLPVAPFRFDPALADKPSRFEFNFIQGGVRYFFELALTSERVVEERLIVYPKGKEQLLYERVFNGTAEYYVFGEYLEGGEDLHETWRKITGSQSLFLAQAVANSSEELKQLRAPFDWFVQGPVVVDKGMRPLHNSVQDLVSEMPSFGDEISELLGDVDVPISKIRSRTIDESSGELERESFGSGSSSVSKVRTTLTHKTSLGEADFDFDEESEGTKNLFGFSLPWLFFRFEKLHSSDGRRVLVVDELDSSLHPNVVAALIHRHIHAEVPCQLIFTTHDTHLMDTKLLRRDQIWFTERDSAGATQLRSAHDFEGREGEDIEKRYYEGRYRGLPFVRGVRI